MRLLTRQWSHRPRLLYVNPRRFISLPSHSHPHSNGDAPQGPFDILFFGRDEFSCTVFRELHAAPDVVRTVQVVTQPDEKVGRNGSVLSISPLKKLAQTLDVPVVEIPHQRSAFRTWKPPAPFLPSLDSSNVLDPSHLLLTASFGRIISSLLLNLFRPDRRLNVHPSLLPLYRGPAPLQRALMDGRKETGVSILGMTKYVKGGGGVDLGEVWAQEHMDIVHGATFSTLRDALARQGGHLLVQVLRDMIAGMAKSVPQDQLGYTSPWPYAHLVTQDDYRVRWLEQSAQQLVWTHNAIGHERPLTTFLPDGKTSIQLHDPSVITSEEDTFLHLSAPGMAFYHKPSNAVLVRCADHSLLSVKALKQESMKLVPARDFWNGMRGRPAWLGEVEHDGRKLNFVQFRGPAV